MMDFAILDVLLATDQMQTSAKNVFVMLLWMSSGTVHVKRIGPGWTVPIGMAYVIVNVRPVMVPMHVIVRNV